MSDGPMILCVEDEPELLADLTEELVDAGYRVISASNGAEALRACATQVPDLVLCDITMPVMDGFELMERLKADPARFGHVPFIFLTAMAERDEVLEGKRKGADDYLVKPVDYDLLLATLEARLRQVESFRQHSDAESEQSSGLPAKAVLDLITRPIIIVAKDGRVMLANRAAVPIIGAGWENGQIEPQFSPARLKRLLAKSGDGQVSRLSDDDWPELVICRLDDGSAAMFFAPPAAAGDDTRIQRLTDLFQFTNAESRIAMLLCEGLTPTQISEDLGVAATTTAFHLKNLYQKTGTGRQSSLVAMLLSHPATLV